MLLPQVRDAAVRLVAVAAEKVVAAASVTNSLRAKSPIGPGVSVHVIPPYRRRGIGSSLLRSLADHCLAADSKCEAFYATQKVEAGTAAAQGWRWLGFEPLETVVYHELPLSVIEKKLAPMYDWMVSKGGIPQEAEIIPLCDADRPAVARLHTEVLGGDYATLLRLMQGTGIGAYHPVYSRILLVGGKVKGCILAHRESKESAVVDANLLDPSVRGGWANLWLKLEATRGAAALGIERFTYSTFDHYTDTRVFSEMLGGKEVRRMLLMHRLLGDHAEA